MSDNEIQLIAHHFQMVGNAAMKRNKADYMQVYTILCIASVLAIIAVVLRSAVMHLSSSQHADETEKASVSLLVICTAVHAVAIASLLGNISTARSLTSYWNGSSQKKSE
eukprot:m.146636 g.146636  ORF g.146636 m.146636 type:complete len:110 (-) comp17773_c0_seq6:485-814(-)